MATTDCNSGYYHGAMEALLHDTRTAHLAKNRHVCGSFGAEFIRFNCLHGVGHGVMTYENFNLFSSLDLCTELSSATSTRYCYHGVFMEHVAAGLNPSKRSGHTTQWLSDDP